MLSTSFDVRGVPSAQAAFALLDAGESFDVVMCDMQLGGDFDGRDFLERAIVRYPAILRHMVLMSGDPPPDDAFGRATARRWLTKPFTTEDLLALLDLLHEPDGVDAAA